MTTEDFPGTILGHHDSQRDGVLPDGFPLDGVLLDGFMKSCIPPGQIETKKWPVLHYGAVPQVDVRTWTFTVDGLVERPFTLTYEQLLGLPRTTVTCDIHCVTRWSRLDNAFEGVAVQSLLERAGVKPEARHVLVSAEQGFTTNLPLADLDRPENLIAFKHDGAWLSPEHGYPARLLVPHLYFWKSAKWVRGLAGGD